MQSFDGKTRAQLTFGSPRAESFVVEVGRSFSLVVAAQQARSSLDAVSNQA